MYPCITRHPEGLAICQTCKSDRESCHVSCDHCDLSVLASRATVPAVWERALDR